MTTKKLSLGFIGGGINSAVGSVHFVASQMDGLFSVNAGCFSRHADINQATAQKWGVPQARTYSSWEQMLDREKGRLDAIVVLTPTPQHSQPVISAMRAGYAVICEKALAVSSQEAAIIKTVVKETNGFLAVTYNYCGYPMVRELRHLIQAGGLGRVTQIHVEMPQEGFARFNREGQPMIPQPWRLEDGAVPTISLDLGVHVFHLIDFLTGQKPVELAATQSTLGRFQQVIDNSMALVRYADGLESSIWFSKAALGYRNGLRVRVFGETASAEWYQMEPETLIRNDNRGRRILIDRANVDVEIAQRARYNRFKSGHPAGFMEAFANLYADIAEHLCARLSASPVPATDPVPGAHDAWEGLITLEAMTRAAQEQRWAKVDFNIVAHDR